MTHPARTLWLSLVLVAIAPAASAQDAPAATPLYDVELVIFRTLGTSATPEDWSLEEQLAKQRLMLPEEVEGTVPPPAPVTGDLSVTPLPPAEQKLTAIADALRRSRSYQPLLHLAWTQPGLPMQTGTPLIPLSSLGADNAAISGQVGLARGRFLHLTLDLVYQAPESQQHFVLKQSRRIRSGEKHYFDHPYFGVVAIVTPHGQNPG